MYRILSFDGGGIRGLVTLALLKRLESQIPNLIKGADLLAGTSTGGIIALGLAAGKSVDEMIALYRDKGSKIFDDSWWDDLRDIGGATDVLVICFETSPSQPKKSMKTKRNLIQACLLCLALLLPFTSGAQPVTTIATGANFTLFLLGDGSLWGMGVNGNGELGLNRNGQLGVGGTEEFLTPKLVVDSGVTAMAAGAAYSLFLLSGGSLWGLGQNSAGQLGDGTLTDQHTPEMILPSGVTAIAAGDQHSLFIKKHTTGFTQFTELWAMGYNQQGQLGNGTFNSTDVPVKIESYANPGAIGSYPVTAISVGFHHSLFLKSDGSLWGMGYNGDGELGDGTTNNAVSPEQIVASGVTAIAAGSSHSLFLKNDGSLWAMGSDSAGQLGDGSFTADYLPEQIVTSGVTAIAARANQSFFLKSDGSLWAMGYNLSGQLGDGTVGTYPYYGVNVPEQIVPNGVTAIAAGYTFSLFLKSGGTMWAMGDNSDGQIGSSSSPSYPGDFNDVPVQVNPYPPTLAITTVGGQPVVVYPMAGTNYLLEMTTSLSSPNWVTASGGTPAIAVLFTNTTPGGAFFRLR
jgi:alpha-tubulin suppressor-like RCC1 family protein